MKIPKFLLVVTEVEGEAIGTPEVIAFEDFQGLQQKASDATAGNGGYQVLAEITNDYQVTSKTVSDCDNKQCTYYTHYLVYYQPTDEFPYQYQHEAFHAAEDKCEAAQKRYIQWIEDNEGNNEPIPEHLEWTAGRWERAVCA